MKLQTIIRQPLKTPFKARFDWERACAEFTIQVNNNALMKDWRDYYINSIEWGRRYERRKKKNRID